MLIFVSVCTKLCLTRSHDIQPTTMQQLCPRNRWDSLSMGIDYLAIKLVCWDHRVILSMTGILFHWPNTSAGVFFSLTHIREWKIWPFSRSCIRPNKLINPSRIILFIYKHRVFHCHCKDHASKP